MVIRIIMDIDYEFKPAFTLLTVNLEPGESIKVEPGAMVAQSADISVSTGRATSGGLIKGLFKAVVGGESFFVNTYTAGPSGGWISLASSAPGDISTFELGSEEELYLQGGSFMASSQNVETDTKFQGAKSLFSKEGAFFLRAHSSGGDGLIFYTAYGAIKELNVTPNNPIIVDNGHLVAFTKGISYGVAPSGGLKTTVFGGEGLILQLSGSGKVWIQTRNLEALAGNLIPFLPDRSN